MLVQLGPFRRLTNRSAWFLLHGWCDRRASRNLWLRHGNCRSPAYRLNNLNIGPVFL